MAEALGYSVLRSEQVNAIKKSVMSLYLFQLAQGGEPMPAFGLCLSLLTQQNQENLQTIGVGSGDETTNTPHILIKIQQCEVSSLECSTFTHLHRWVNGRHSRLLTTRLLTIETYG